MPHLSHSLQQSLDTQEQLIKKSKGALRFTIGVLKEDKGKETRSALTPQGVSMLVESGHEVYVEEGLGSESNFADLDYTEHGGMLCRRAEALQQDVILKITPPEQVDVEGMKKRSLLFSIMQYHEMCKETLEAMRLKCITAVAMDWIEGVQGECPIANSMKEIEGNAAIVFAANMSCYPKGKGAMLGSVAGVSPSEVVIMGAGMAGQTAAKTAIGMGATVKFFDSSLRSLQKMRNSFGNHIFTSILHPNALAKSLKGAEVVIGALGEDENILPFVISEDLVHTMKKGAIIIDLNIDKGGSFETSRVTTIKKPTYKDKGIHYCCLPALATMYPRTASIALSNIIAPLLLNMHAYENRGQYICSEQGFQKGIYMYNGVLSNFSMGRRYNISAKDLQLLLTVF
ncbi:MAG: alanine dehydrogenase [Bacteroidales bacterium]|jgi:alanine dehydrogenase|nr:alanine dehydrogenase [Bacteroidales bacterium]